MAFQKGKNRPANAGRKKGTPNKATACVRDALTETFTRIGDIPALADWAKENPTAFYSLWVKMMPAKTELSGVDGGAIQIENKDKKVEQEIARLKEEIAVLDAEEDPEADGNTSAI